MGAPELDDLCGGQAGEFLEWRLWCGQAQGLEVTSHGGELLGGITGCLSATAAWGVEAQEFVELGLDLAAFGKLFRSHVLSVELLEPGDCLADLLVTVPICGERYEAAALGDERVDGGWREPELLLGCRVDGHERIARYEEEENLGQRGL